MSKRSLEACLGALIESKDRTFQGYLAEAMLEKYAVVDIETTGLFHQGHGITEIAVVHVDADEMCVAFHSMIQPQRSVPLAVRHITGISDRDIKDAPLFAEKADELMKALEGRIFVAHQVGFDYNFLKRAFSDCGMSLSLKRLCTIRLAKKSLPHLRSARLAELCIELGVVNKAPHRALGDAMATAQILQHLAQVDGGDHLRALLHPSGRAAVLPPGLTVDQINEIPEAPGVYFFYGEDANNPLYIGKAINLRKRVLSHFTSSGSTVRKQLFQRYVRQVKCRITSSEYTALLLEDVEIKKHLPRYNIAQKSRRPPMAVRLYESRGGLRKLGIVTATGCAEELAVFETPHSARQWLLGQAKHYGFNPERAGLSTLYLGEQYLLEEGEHAAFDAFVSDTRANRSASNYVLVEPECDGLCSFVWFNNGRYRGFGTLPPSTELTAQTLEATATIAPESMVARAVLRRMEMDSHITKVILE